MTNDVPTPKFHKGQTVFRPYAIGSTEKLQCPDCLSSQKWKVTTPSGIELEADCARCCGWNKPPLTLPDAVPGVHELTIGSIRIDTHKTDEAVEYMCVETGVGSGQVYRESFLFESEDEATKASDRMAAEMRARLRKKINEPEIKKLRSLTYRDAMIHDAEIDVERIRGKLRDLRWEIRYVIEESDDASADSIIERLKALIDYESKESQAA